MPNVKHVIFVLCFLKYILIPVDWMAELHGQMENRMLVGDTEENILVESILKYSRLKIKNTQSITILD